MHVWLHGSFSKARYFYIIAANGTAQAQRCTRT